MMRAAMMGAGSSRAEDDDRPIMRGRDLLAIAALDYDPARRPAPAGIDKMEVEEGASETTQPTEATTTSDRESKSATTRAPRGSRPSLVGQATADWFPHVPEEGGMDSTIIADLPDDPLLPPDVLPTTTTATATEGGEGESEGGGDVSKKKMMEMETEGGEPPLGMRWAKRFAYGEAGIRSAREWVRRGVPAVLSGFPVITFDPTDPPCPYYSRPILADLFYFLLFYFFKCF
jgi:hypothetical protein